MKLSHPSSKWAFSFFKYEASGNDFVLIEDLEETFPLHNEAYIAQICHRKRGVGSDGLLLIQSSKRADYQMRIFNSDGQEAKMCGNGLRILGAFLLRENESSSLQIATEAGIYKIEKKEGQIWAFFPKPQVFSSFTLIHQGRSSKASLVEAGVRHLLIEDPDLDDYASLMFLRDLRMEYDANVSLYFTEKESTKIRTFERGVEGETSSCGTATVSLASLLPFSQAEIRYPKDALFTTQDATYIGLSGDVRLAFSGQFPF